MRKVALAVALAAVISVTAERPFAQTTAPAAAQAQAQVPAPAPLTDAEIEQFLSTAKITRTRSTEKGITGSIRATLSDGTRTHDAHIQIIDEAKREFQSMRGVEFNFRDRWQFNVAAYKIDRLLGLNIVPVSVERMWRSSPAAFTWWVDDVLMDEEVRLKKKVPPPDPQCWNEQSRLLRIFDHLIENVDRNLGNMLITKTWRVWAIDHTRAFRRSMTVKNPANMSRMDRELAKRLAALDEPTLKKEVGRYIDGYDIRALLSRRDSILDYFAKLGEPAFFDRNPNCGMAASESVGR